MNTTTQSIPIIDHNDLPLPGLPPPIHPVINFQLSPTTPKPSRFKLPNSRSLPKVTHTHISITLKHTSTPQYPYYNLLPIVEFLLKNKPFDNNESRVMCYMMHYSNSDGEYHCGYRDRAIICKKMKISVDMYKGIMSSLKRQGHIKRCKQALRSPYISYELVGAFNNLARASREGNRVKVSIEI